MITKKKAEPDKPTIQVPPPAERVRDETKTARTVAKVIGHAKDSLKQDLAGLKGITGPLAAGVRSRIEDALEVLGG